MEKQTDPLRQMELRRQELESGRWPSNDTPYRFTLPVDLNTLHRWTEMARAVRKGSYGEEPMMQLHPAETMSQARPHQ